MQSASYLPIAVEILGAALIAAGVISSVLPGLPGIPLVFGGIWLCAGADHYRHLGIGWLLGIGSIGAVGFGLELIAGALGARRQGASRRAVVGALIGSLVGVFLGLPGLLLGPFVGAVLGELSAGNGVLRSAEIGVGTWIGLILGTIAKFVASLMMLAVAATAWWWRHGT